MVGEKIVALWMNSKKDELPDTVNSGSDNFSESALQAECFLLAWNHLPETRYCLFAVPNGGYRGKLEGARMKATGTVAGIPDMILIWNGKVTGLEFKAGNGKLSPAQEKCHAIWRAQGIGVGVIRSVEEFRMVFEGVTGLKLPE